MGLSAVPPRADDRERVVRLVRSDEQAHRAVRCGDRPQLARVARQDVWLVLFPRGSRERWDWGGHGAGWGASAVQGGTFIR